MVSWSCASVSPAATHENSSLFTGLYQLGMFCQLLTAYSKGVGAIEVSCKVMLRRCVGPGGVIDYRYIHCIRCIGSKAGQSLDDTVIP